MGIRVRALYQNSQPVLVLIVAFWIGTTVIGCVRVPSMHDPLPTTDIVTQSGRCFPAISLCQIRGFLFLRLRRRRPGMSAVPPI